jgi:hypothetical protein
MANNNRHDLPPRVTSLMWFSLIRAPWLLDSLASPRHGQPGDRPRDNSRNGRFRDY